MAESLEELRRQLDVARGHRAHWHELALPWMEQRHADPRRYARSDHGDPSSRAYTNFLACQRTIISLEEMIREREDRA